MVLEHNLIIHLIDVVTGKDEYIVRVVVIDILDVLVDRVCCA